MGGNKFLELYSGETTDELIAKAGEYRVDSIVLAFELAIEAKRARTSVSREEEIVLAVEALEREVNNGGYHQFFINPSVEHVAIIVQALQEISCPKTAEITSAAISTLELTAPWTPEKVEAAAHERYEEVEEALNGCDNRYYENDEPIADRLFEWIQLNRHRIQLSETSYASE